jgi:hypothetical protein
MSARDLAGLSLPAQLLAQVLPAIPERVQSHPGSRQFRTALRRQTAALPFPLMPTRRETAAALRELGARGIGPQASYGAGMGPNAARARRDEIRATLLAELETLRPGDPKRATIRERLDDLAARDLGASTVDARTARIRAERQHDAHA